MLVYRKSLKQKSFATMKKIATLSRRKLIVTALCASVALFAAPQVFADRFDDQINGIQNEITGYQARANELSSQADTLQKALDVITNEKNVLQAQIDLNQAKLDQLTADIKTNEEKLDRQKRTLNKTVAQIYANGDTTPIVMLASSKNIGEYVSAQEVRSSVRDQMKTAMDQVKKLKAELAKQKKEVESVLADQTKQREVLAAKENEQANLVAQTRGEEAAYQNLISSKNSEISSLRTQQAAANAAAASTYNVSNLTPGAGCGGYPAVWCNAGQDTLVDNWGMYNRECVSFTAWKVAASGRRMPYWGGNGNANQWPSSAAASGIPTGSTPVVGSVAIMYVGYYGHAMYVERINANGTIHVSQFNWGIRGEYSEMDVSPNGLTFIYF
jgi:peptidoglycan hydrolase CwlO-like protein